MPRALPTVALALMAFVGHAAASAAGNGTTYTCSVNMETSSAEWGCGCDERDGTGYDKDAKTWSKPAVPCKLGDCKCHPQCYDCPGTYEHVYKSAFQVWQYSLFVLFFVAFVLVTKVFFDYVRAQRKRGLKNRAQASAIDRFCGFKVKVQLWVLLLSWIACLGRLMWLNSPRNSDIGPYGAQAMAFYMSQTNIAFMLKLPEVLFMGGAILLGLVFKETVDRSKNMGQGGEQKVSTNQKGIIAVVVLFVLTIPGALTEPEHVLNLVGNLAFILYALGCCGLLINYGRALGKMIRGSGGDKMVKTAKTILLQVKLLSLCCFGVFFSLVFNIFVQNVPWDHMIFWSWVHLSEWICPMTIAYSLRQTKKGNANVAKSSASVAPSTKG